MKKPFFLMIVMLLCFTIACKKEETNDPDIKDVSLNIKVEAVYPTLLKAVDVNLDGEVLQDFTFVISHPGDEPDNHLVNVDVYDSKYEFLTNWEPGIVITQIKTIQKGSNIQPSSAEWRGGSCVFYYKYPAIGTYGFTDIGDQYIAFRKKNLTGGYQYGWMLVNVENGEKLSLKEYAIRQTADTPIKAGEK